MEQTNKYQNEVYSAALRGGMNDTLAKLITAQATHETGNFKSNVFLKTNNAFGMKVPRVRKTIFILQPSDIVRKSEGATAYAQYSDLKNSVFDLINWLQYNKCDFSQIKNTSDYANFLKQKGFYGAEISEYLNGLNSFFKKYTGLKTTGLPFILIVSLAFLTYFLTTQKF